MISYQNPGSNAFSRLKMPKNNLIADNFLIQFFAHAILKYSVSAKESTLTVYKGNVCKKWRKKIEVRSGERLHLQWHKDTFSQAHDSADSKLKVKPINTPYKRFSPPTKTTETATSLVRLSRFALRDSPIKRMRLVDPDQRLITCLKCIILLYT